MTKFTTEQLLLRIGITEVLDVQDVALLIKRSEGAIRNMVSKREIPHYKNERGNVTFRKSEIEEWQLGKRIPTIEEITTKAVTYTAIKPR